MGLKSVEMARLGIKTPNKGENTPKLANTKMAFACNNYSKDVICMNERVKKSMICKRIGAKVAFYRTLKGLTQETLAIKCHIGKSTLGRIERGEYTQGLSVITLIDIAEGLGIDVSAFFVFTKQEKRAWKQMLLEIEEEE